MPTLLKKNALEFDSRAVFISYLIFVAKLNYRAEPKPA